MTRRLSKALLALGLVAATPVPATAQATPAARILYEKAKLLASDGAARDFFGRSVAISGDTLVIGARANDDLADGSGSAYVFERDDAGTWTETAKVLPSDGAAGDFFGSSVAISGAKLVVGARFDDHLGDDSGSAYVFERDPTGIWTETAKLLPADGARLDEFGYSVAIWGDRLIVGAFADDSPPFEYDAGSAYVFERDPTGTWTETAKLLPADGAGGDFFGNSVAISANKVVVGAWGHHDHPFEYNAGAAYVFERDPTGIWTETAKLLPADGATLDYFGISVAISGDRLVVGALLDDDLRSDSGSAYVFERDQFGSWAEVAKLLASDGAPRDYFGISVAIWGERVVVGAEWDDDLGQDSGSAYLFEREESGTWAELAKLLPSDGESFDRFGESVAISGDRLVAGAPLDDELGDGSGSTYTFSLEDCVLDLDLSPETVRAGEDLEVAIHLEHNRPQTVTVPFLVWIEAADGRLIASRASEPRTFRHGDMADVTFSVPLPPDLPPGFYKVLVGIEKMQQGRAGAAAPFEVIAGPASSR